MTTDIKERIKSVLRKSGIIRISWKELEDLIQERVQKERQRTLAEVKKLINHLSMASLRLTESGAELDNEITRIMRKREEPTTRATEYLEFAKEEIEKVLEGK